MLLLLLLSGIGSGVRAEDSGRATLAARGLGLRGALVVVECLVGGGRGLLLLLLLLGSGSGNAGRGGGLSA